MLKNIKLCDVLNMFKEKNVLSKFPKPLVATIPRCLTVKQACNVFTKPDETDKVRQAACTVLSGCNWVYNKKDKQIITLCFI